MNKSISENYKIFSSRINLFQKFGYNVSEEMRFIIDKARPIEGQVLEVGTGKGRFAIELAREGLQFTTIDVSDEEQRFARMNIQHLGFSNQVNFIIADAGNLNFEDNRFNVCLGVNFVHHLTQPQKVVDELLRVTASGGRLMLSDFNEKGFSIIEKIHKNEGRHHEVGDFSLDDLAEYALDRIERIEKFQSDCLNTIIIYKKLT